MLKYLIPLKFNLVGMKKIIIASFLFISFYSANAQTYNNVGIGTLTPNQNAILDVSSTTKGLLTPRMSTTEKTTLGSSMSLTEQGMLVYDTDTQTFWYWDGNSWIEAIGPQGPTGPSGADGKDGNDGAQGPAGPAGASGSNGATGATGPSGADGSNNAWGLTGNAGTSTSTNFLGTTDSKDLLIKTNNTERLRVMSSGNVGIGTSSPSAFLFVDAPSSTNALRVRTNSTTRLFVGSDGNVGIHSYTPPCFLFYKSISTMSDWNVQFESAYDDGLARFYNTTSSNESRVLMGATEYTGSSYLASGVIGLALGYSGSGGVGVYGGSNCNDSYGIYANLYNGTSSSAAGWALYADGWAGGVKSWQNVSDKRLKKNIVTIGGALDKVMKLRGVEYNFDDTNFPGIDLDTKTKQIGFIAQEVEEIFPELVREANITSSKEADRAGMKDQKPTYKVKTLSYTDLIPVLTEAIKEQQKTIESLESRIAILEQKK